MTRREWLVRGMTPAVAVFAAGCNNKGKRARNVKVEVSKKLADMGVSLEDWRYSESQKTFGIRLRTSKPVEKHTYLIIRGEGIGQVQSVTMISHRINAGEWIDFGGKQAFGAPNPFEHLPDSGTITIDVMDPR